MDVFFLKHGVVEIDEVYTKLRKIKLNKSVCPDGISHKILKEMAYYLVVPLAGIINSSLRQGIVPDQWKISRITPITKVFPPKNVESDVMPIAVTNTMAKIAEKFVLSILMISMILIQTLTSLAVLITDLLHMLC